MYIKQLSKYLPTGLALLPAVALADLGGGADAAGKGTGTSADLAHFFGVISNVLIYLVGAISVIMLIIGGLRYVISQGDAGAVKQAKDTILYSIIGIVVAIIAYALVKFISNSIT